MIRTLLAIAALAAVPGTAAAQAASAEPQFKVQSTVCVNEAGDDGLRLAAALLDPPGVCRPVQVATGPNILTR